MPADLVLLVADKNIEHGVRGLLGRAPALGIRPVTSTIYVHPQHDPACAHTPHEFLRQFSRDYHRALVLFDHQGCGMEGRAPAEIEADVRQLLSANGWDSRADVVVIVPELEAWVFAPSSSVEACLRWSGTSNPSAVARSPGLWSPQQLKPADPKAALEAALVKLRRSRSSAIYGDLANAVGLGQCQDPAFTRFRTILQDWFPAAGH
jgi:hypothetical protein